MTDTPIPCPFCGGGAGWHSEHDADGAGVFYAIRCRECRAQSGLTFVSNGNDCPQFRAEIRAAWNRRTPAPLEAGGGDDGKDGELHPQAALAYAKRMKTFCEAFDGRDWPMAIAVGFVDTQNLAIALDNLTECAAMLMNMAERVSGSPPVAGGGGQPWDAWLGEAFVLALQGDYSKVDELARTVKISFKSGSAVLVHPPVTPNGNASRPLSETRLDAADQEWTRTAPQLPSAEFNVLVKGSDGAVRYARFNKYEGWKTDSGYFWSMFHPVIVGWKEANWPPKTDEEQRAFDTYSLHGKRHRANMSLEEWTALQAAATPPITSSTDAGETQKHV